MSKPIVVGVDGSEHSQRAARYAAELATRLSTELLLVHVVPSIAMPADVIGFGEQLLQANRVRGEALLDVMVNQLSRPDLKVKKRLIDLRPSAEALADVAGDMAAELVVVGSTGSGAVARVLLGSVADRLSHISPVPVLIVR